MRLRQAPFVDRNFFAAHLNERGLVGTAVEVGVHRAEFAAIFLANWHGQKYVGVDSYPTNSEPLCGSGPTREDDYKHARLVLRPHKHAAILRLPSLVAAGTFADESLDFVYVDASHIYENVRADIAAWWPKVRRGGILAGHDWLTHGTDEPACDHIQRAVEEFAEPRDLEVRIVVEMLCLPWSFFVEKPA